MARHSVVEWRRAADESLRRSRQRRLERKQHAELLTWAFSFGLVCVAVGFALFATGTIH